MAVSYIVRRALRSGNPFSDNNVMTPTAVSSPIACTSATLSAVDTDLLVVPWFEGEGPEAVLELDRSTGGEVSRALAAKEFAGRPYELFIAPVTDRGWRPRRIALIGAGRAAAFGGDLARKVATAVGLNVRQRWIGRAAFVLRADPTGATPLAELAQAVAEGLTLSEFDAGSYKTDDPPPAKAPAWTLAVSGVTDDGFDRVNGAVARGRLLGECSNLARTLANEPGNTLTPREFARRCEALAIEGGISVEILDEEQIAQLGMGLLPRGAAQRAAPGDRVPPQPAGRPRHSRARPGRQR